MLGFYEKRKLRQWLHSKPFLVLLLVPIGFLTYATHNAYNTLEDTAMHRSEVASELDQLQARANMLEADIRELEDPRGVEAALRQRYEVGRDGEEVVVLIEEEQERVEHEPTEEPAPRIWERIRKVLRW